MTTEARVCPVCGGPAGFAFKVMGKVPPVREFSTHHCPACRFSFVADGRTDYEDLYTDEYYQGRGADHLVDYLFDLREPGLTARRYEWNGLIRIFMTLMNISDDSEAAGLKWLDYGCGFGSLVRFGRERGLDLYGYEPYGFRDSKVVESLSEAERRFLQFILTDDAPPAPGTWDYVTAIEVIEHAHEPLEFLAGIRPLLKPGGILFLTTGNARPHRRRLDKWSYSTCPDVHVSFFEPETLALALEKAGFRPAFPGYVPGFTELIASKILKNLGFKRNRAVFGLIPWPLLSRAADALMRVSAMPVGIAS